MKVRYRDLKLNAASLWQINNVNTTIDFYASIGYNDMTLRQVFYQLVTKNIIKNTFQNYKSLGVLISKGRLAGLIDWYAISDATRFIRKRGHSDSVAEFMTDINLAYARDLRQDQPEYIEVWVEKDAMIGIVERTSNRNDVPSFSCRGNVSQTEMWNAAQRLIQQSQNGTRPVTIIHLGDHDPSGIDMSRDIEDRLTEFGAESYGIHINRIALNMDQVQEYKPPTNPAKETDSRFKKYKERFGTESWELDALDPRVVDALIQKHIDEHTDADKYAAQLAVQEQHRDEIKKAEKFSTDVGAWIEKQHLVEVGTIERRDSQQAVGKVSAVRVKLDPAANNENDLYNDRAVFIVSEEEADEIENTDVEFEE